MLSTLQQLLLASGIVLSGVQHTSASCAYGTHLHRRQEGNESEAVPIGTFGYTGTISPLNWLSLDPAANKACSTGRNQSPINMVQGQFTLRPASDLQLVIPDVAETEFENLGTTVEVIMPAGAGMTVDGVAFQLKQFHFHLPSEHIDNGRSFAMEMHNVFESADGQIAVVGVYLDTAGNVAGAAPSGAATERRHARDTSSSKRGVAGATTTGEIRSIPIAASGSSSILNSILAAIGLADSSAGVGGASGGVGAAVPVIEAAPAATGGTNLFETVFASVGQIATPGTRTKIGPLVMSDLLASLNAGQFQNYAGSLTTPPCSEGVRWFVSTQKQTISLQAFSKARDVIGFNSRFPQNALGQDNVIALAVSANTANAAAPAVAARRRHIH